MKQILMIMILICTIAGIALANREVYIDSNGIVTAVGYCYGKGAVVDHAANKYTDEEWAAFGITSDEPYIIKDGAVWRNMTAAETNAVNTQLQTLVADKAKHDAKWDAIMTAIAEAVKNNLKTKAEVEAVFKNGIDPKKAKEEEKNK